MIDLHSHTNKSDGLLSPAELITLAKEYNLDSIAITDHDTIAGVNEAIIQGEKLGIEVIPGVELSCIHPDVEREIHLLGLFINHEDEGFLKFLDELKGYRRIRNLEFIDNLKKVGVNLSEDDFIEKGKTLNSAGKPDFGRIITEKGFTKNPYEAMNKYLDDIKGTAKVNKKRVTIEEAIKRVQEAGGVAILAHPFTLLRRASDLLEIILKFVDLGLDGLEVFYNHYKKNQVKFLKRTAKHNRLFMSGGSDFHSPGDLRNSKLGYYGPKKNIPDEILEDLKRWK